MAIFAEAPYAGAALAFASFLCADLLLPRPHAWAALLPFTRALLSVGAAVAGIAVLAIAQITTGLPGIGTMEMAVVLAVTGLAAGLTRRRSHRRFGIAPVRVAVIGSRRHAVDLARELALAGVDAYVVVGRIAPDDADPELDREVPTLGALADLCSLVELHGIRLLVMTGEVPRFRVFDEVARTSLHLPVRLWELSGFYEDVFGQVPVADINGAWFQYIMHPDYRAIAPATKRIIDVVVAGLALLFFLPLLAVLAVLIRRDGGPVFFRQIRIGEGGRPLTVYKLRTMRPAAAAPAQWAAADDPRVTPIGRLLRRTHVDELPQLFNVLRGDMSLVGPRPEQPAFVDELETVVPFYQRRHLVKPGITGWAQVRCGYAGSNIGSAWKLSHDLYYIKHRSVLFDLTILAETVRTMFFDRQYALEPRGPFFILREETRPESPSSRSMA